MSGNDVEIVCRSKGWKQKGIIRSIVMEINEGKKHTSLKIAGLSENVFMKTVSEQEC